MCSELFLTCEGNIVLISTQCSFNYCSSIQLVWTDISVQVEQFGFAKSLFKCSPAVAQCDVDPV